TTGLQAGDVLKPKGHPAVRVLRLWRPAAVEAAQNQQRSAVRGSDSAFGGDTRDGEASFQQRRHGGKALTGLERQGAVAFVKDDAERGLVFKGHGRSAGK